MAKTNKTHKQRQDDNKVSHVPSCNVEVVDDSNGNAIAPISQDENVSQDRRDTLITYFTQGMPIREAAIKAGYSESYANTKLIHQLSKSAEFKRLVFAKLGIDELTQLVKIVKFEGAVTDWFHNKTQQELTDNDIEKLSVVYPKFARTFKEKKQTTGLLKPEMEQPVSHTISVVSVQNLLLNVHNNVSD